MTIQEEIEALKAAICDCKVCEKDLPMGANPVAAFSETAKILIIGQAPGIRVHRSGIPWNDPSGDNLRKWMDINKETFYDDSKIAIVPMGLCYPGTAERGDLPPRKECAPLWHSQILNLMPNLELTLLVGMYAQKSYLGKRRKKNLTETVLHFKEYLPEYLPLVHPSPRNRIWQKKNPWFEAEVVPEFRTKVKEILNK